MRPIAPTETPSKIAPPPVLAITEISRRPRWQSVCFTVECVCHHATYSHFHILFDGNPRKASFSYSSASPLRRTSENLWTSPSWNECCKRKSSGSGHPPRHPPIDRTRCLHLSCHIWIWRQANRERLSNMGADTTDRQMELPLDEEHWLPHANEVSVYLCVRPCVAEWRGLLYKINAPSLQK